MSRLYVYALVDERLPRASVHGHRIESVAVGGIYALAERTDRMPPVSEEALREQHAIVMRLAERAHAILPARFGSLLEDDELARVVAHRRDRLQAALDLVRDREQMTVRLIGATDRTPQTEAPAKSGASAGTRYLEQRRAAAGYPLPDAVARLSASMRADVVAEKAEPGRHGVRAVLYHLIQRGTSAAYCGRLAQVSSGAAPFEVTVSGPWPPFAFTPELLG